MSAATDTILPRYPAGLPGRTVKNTSGGALAAGASVKLDTSNPMSATQGAPGVVATSAVADVTYGFLVNAIPNGQFGECQVIDGTEVQAIALGAISAGATVGPSTTAGQVTTYTAGNPSSGIAITAATAAADPILIQIRQSKNA